MTTTSREADVLSDESDNIITLSTGHEIRIERVRTRQMLRFIRIFTRGAGAFLGDINFSTKDQEALFSQILAALVYAIPEAEDETIDFLFSLVSPVGAATPNASWTKKDREEREAAIARFHEEVGGDFLFEDTISIVSAFLKRELPNLRSLGNQLAALLPKAAGTKPQPTASKKQPATSKTASPDSTEQGS